MKSFAGKNVLVTGGSSGIGLALAKKLAVRGANLCLLARDPVKLEHACQQVQQQAASQTQVVRVIQADVSDDEQVSQAIKTLISQTGVPDLLINSAGITHPGLFEQMDLQIHRRTMEINYFGTLYATRAVVPGMIKRRSGHILNISSLVGYHGLYGYSAYSPSKFAVRGLSDSLRYELKPYGIQISVAYPSDTETPQLEYENRHKPPVLKALSESNNTPVSADIVAEKILSGVQKDRYIILPSSDSRILFWVYSMLPGYSMYRFVDILMKRARRKAANNLTGEKNKAYPD